MLLMAVFSFGSFQAAAFDTFEIGIVGIGIAMVVSAFALLSIAVARCSASTVDVLNVPGVPSSLKRLEP